MPSLFSRLCLAWIRATPVGDHAEFHAYLMQSARRRLDRMVAQLARHVRNWDVTLDEVVKP